MVPLKKFLFRFCLLLLLLTAIQTKKEINILQLTIALFDRQIKEKKVVKAFYLFFVPFCPHMESFEETVGKWSHCWIVSKAELCKTFAKLFQLCLAIL